MRPPLKLKLPSWLSPKHPVVMRELANIKRAVPMKLPFSPAVQQKIEQVSWVVLALMVGSYTISAAIALPNYQVLLGLGMGVGFEADLMMLFMGIQSAQMIARERVQGTWNALRLTTLSDAALAGGKLRALAQFQGAMGLILYMPQFLALAGLFKLVGAGRRPTSLEEGILWLWLAGVVVSWFTYYPTLVWLTNALVGLAASTLGAAKYTNFWAGGLAFGLLVSYLLVQGTVQLGLRWVLNTTMPKPLWLYYDHHFAYFLWGQAVAVQIVLYLLVIMGSVWVLRRRLPYLTE